jgi:4-amino-4-deoxy-L-arabinose transferase-like glycosyltransferase
VIQRIVSTIVGGLVTFLLLLLFHNGRLIADETMGFLVAVAIGALVNLFWPWIWSAFMDRRRYQSRQQAVRVEVARQVDAQRTVESEPPPVE